MKYNNDKYVMMTVPGKEIRVGDYILTEKKDDELVTGIRLEDDLTGEKLFADVAHPNKKPVYVLEVSMESLGRDRGLEYIWPVGPEEMIEILRFSLKDLLNEI